MARLDFIALGPRRRRRIRGTRQELRLPRDAISEFYCIGCLRGDCWRDNIDWRGLDSYGSTLEAWGLDRAELEREGLIRARGF